MNQQDHIDYMGYSLFFAWVQPNSQISIGAVYQDGKGEAQKDCKQYSNTRRDGKCLHNCNLGDT